MQACTAGSPAQQMLVHKSWCCLAAGGFMAATVGRLTGARMPPSLPCQ